MEFKEDSDEETVINNNMDSNDTESLSIVEETPPTPIRDEKSLSNEEYNLIDAIATEIPGLEILRNSTDIEEIIELIYDTTLINREAFLQIKKILIGSSEVIKLLSSKEIPQIDRLLTANKADADMIFQCKTKLSRLDKQSQTSYRPTWQIYGEEFEKIARRTVLNKYLFKGEKAFMTTGTILYDLKMGLASTPDFLVIDLKNNNLNYVLPDSYVSKRKTLPIILKPQLREEFEAKRSILSFSSPKTVVETTKEISPTFLTVINQSSEYLYYSMLKRADVEGIGECKTSILTAKQYSAFLELFPEYKTKKKTLVEHLFKETKPKYICDSFMSIKEHRAQPKIKGINDDLIQKIENCTNDSEWLYYVWG